MGEIKSGPQWEGIEIKKRISREAEVLTHLSIIRYIQCEKDTSVLTSCLKSCQMHIRGKREA